MMRKSNQTLPTEFFILGLSQNPNLQVPIFIAFLLMYLMTLSGNLFLVTAISSDPHLHKPMYYFLLNLSILDIGFTTVTTPKMLVMCSTGKKSITFSACIVQFYLCVSFISTEFFLLSVMAYDRYVAICNPLRYAVIMDTKSVLSLAAISWTLGFLDTIPHAVMISQLSFCGSTDINHFFCDFSALLKLSCTDTFFINIVTFVEGAVLGVGPFLLTITSYVFIVSNIMRIPSNKGKLKSFSTCSSHLTAVILFSGTELGVYMRPTSVFSLDKDKLCAVLYTLVIPMLNPLVYSLRNNDVKRALTNVKGRLCQRKMFPHSFPLEK